MVKFGSTRKSKDILRMERNGQRHVSQRVTKHFKTILSIPSRLVILVALNTQLVGLQDSRSYLTANSTSDPTCLHSCSQSPRLLLPNVFARCRPPRHIKTHIQLITRHSMIPYLISSLTSPIGATRLASTASSSNPGFFLVASFA